MTMLSANGSARPDAAAQNCAFVRVIRAVVGLGLVFAALALWLVPGLDPVPEVRLMKLGLSLLLGLWGAGLFVGARLDRL